MEKEFWMMGDILLKNVHPEAVCLGRTCVIHNPSGHFMSSWPLLWDQDRLMFERVCPHDIKHPDPDQYDYWGETGREFEAVHGCDGCCIQTIRGEVIQPGLDASPGSRPPRLSKALQALTAFEERLSPSLPDTGRPPDQDRGDD